MAFIDPPYADDCGIRAIEELASRKLVYSGGMIVYERDRAFTGTIAGLDVTDERKYGKTYLTFFQPNTVN